MLINRAIFQVWSRWTVKKNDSWSIGNSRLFMCKTTSSLVVINEHDNQHIQCQPETVKTSGSHDVDSTCICLCAGRSTRWACGGGQWDTGAALRIAIVAKGTTKYGVNMVRNPTELQTLYLHNVSNRILSWGLKVFGDLKLNRILFGGNVVLRPTTCRW